MLNFYKKNPDVSKIKGVFALKGIISETKYEYLLMYQVPSFAMGLRFISKHKIQDQICPL